MDTTNKLIELLDKYADTFGDVFPTMCFQTDSDENLMERIQRCLDENVPAKKLFSLDYKHLY